MIYKIIKKSIKKLKIDNFLKFKKMKNIHNIIMINLTQY